MPHLIVIVGPCGSGKSTLENTFCKLRGFGKCISTTTRDIRSGEVNGVDYHFTSKTSFELMVENGEFVETGFFGGHHYGLSKASLKEAALAGNGVAVLVAEIEGWQTIEREIAHTYSWADPDLYSAYKSWTTTGIFLHVRPGIAAARLTTRGDLFGDKLKRRIQGIPDELKNVSHFINSPHGRVLYEPTLKQSITFVEQYDPSAAVKTEAKLDQVSYQPR